MKTAETYSITAAKASFIVNEEKGTVKIRMADFYPGYNGEKEYEEVSKDFFNEFYAPLVKFDCENRAIPDCSIIKVKIHDIYPHMNCGSKIIEMTKSQYDEILRHRKKYGTILVKTKDLYPDDKSGQEFLEISIALYNEIVKMKWKEDYEFNEKRNGLVLYEYDEIKSGEMDGIFTESCENEVQLSLLIRDLFAQYGSELERIAIRYLINGESPKSISISFDKNLPAVWKAIRKIKRIVKMAGYSYFV